MTTEPSSCAILLGRTGIALVALVVLGACGNSPDSAATRLGCAECTSFVGRYFDGSAMKQGVVVVGADGFIAEVSNDVSAPLDGSVVALEEETLLPGMIDLHTHVLATSGEIVTIPISDYEANLKALLRHGVTSVVQLGGLSGPSFELRRRVRDGELLSPNLFASGPFLDPLGGAHCTLGARPFGHCVSLISAEHARSVTDALMLEEPDLIKITHDSGFATRPSTPMPEAYMRAIIEGAGSTKVIAHIKKIEDVESALAAGLKYFTHLPFDQIVTAATAERWAAAGAVFIPTVSITMREHQLVNGLATDLDDPELSADVPAHVIAEVAAFHDLPHDDDKKARVAEVLDIVETSFKNLQAAGVTLLPGTDAGIFGVFFGRSLVEDLIQHVNLGRSELDALSSVTMGAADFLGREDLGVIRQGARADFLIVDGDPSIDITKLREPTKVYLGGVAMDREALRVDRDLSLGVPYDLPAGSRCLSGEECGVLGTCLLTYECATTCLEHTDCASLSFCARSESNDRGCYDTINCSVTAQNCANAANCVPVANGATTCISSGSSANGESCASGPCQVGSYCHNDVCRPFCSTSLPCNQGSCVALTETGVDVGVCE